MAKKYYIKADGEPQLLNKTEISFLFDTIYDSVIYFHL